MPYFGLFRDMPLRKFAVSANSTQLQEMPCTRSTSHLITNAAFPEVQRAHLPKCKSSLVFGLKINCGSNMKIFLRMLQQTTSEK